MAILIAPVGNSPGVVMATVHALATQQGAEKVEISTIILLVAPDDEQSFRLIRDSLKSEGYSNVEPHFLDYRDADSDEANRDYLHHLREVLVGVARPGGAAPETIVISCSGGRKSMAALAGVVTPEFPEVRGLYHLIDLNEHTPRALPPLHVILRDYPEEERVLLLQRLGRTDVRLFTLPPSQQEVAPPPPETAPVVDVTLLRAAYVRQILNGAQPTITMDVRFTETVVTTFRALDQQNPSEGRRLWDLFMDMSQPFLVWRPGVTSAWSRPERAYHIYQPTPDAYAVYTTEPAVPDEAHPLKRIVVAGYGLGTFDATRIASFPERVAPDPRVGTGALLAQGHLLDLTARLVITLGRSPMVVTQTVQLLYDLYGVRTREVIMVTPAAEVVQQSADLVESFYDAAKTIQEIRTLWGDQRPLPEVVRRYQLKDAQGADLADVDSSAACVACRVSIAGLLADLQKEEQTKDPTKEQIYPIYLSIAGGRKSMAAMAYEAASLAHLPAVWHTVIADRTLEDIVVQETDAMQLPGRSRLEMAKVMVLHRGPGSLEELTREQLGQGSGGTGAADDNASTAQAKLRAAIESGRFLTYFKLFPVPVFGPSGLHAGQESGR